MGARGVDVSNNNGGRWPSGQVEFLWAKASEGATYDDRFFEGYVDHAAQLGIPWGPYHFPHPDANSPEKEAAWFLKMARRGPLGWALDVENRGSINPLAIMGAAALTAWCERFRTLVEPTLGQPWFYTFRSNADALFPRLSPAWRIWLATGKAVPTYPTYPVQGGGRAVHIEQLGIVDGFDRNEARIALTDTPVPPTGDDDDMVPPLIFQLADNGDLVVLPGSGARPWIGKAGDAGLISVFVFRVLDPDPSKKWPFPNPIPSITDPAQIKEVRGWLDNVATSPGGGPISGAFTLQGAGTIGG